MKKVVRESNPGTVSASNDEKKPALNRVVTISMLVVRCAMSARELLNRYYALGTVIRELSSSYRHVARLRLSWLPQHAGVRQSFRIKPPALMDSS
jgi:hypothetical protein